MYDLGKNILLGLSFFIMLYGCKSLGGGSQLANVNVGTADLDYDHVLIEVDEDRDNQRVQVVKETLAKDNSASIKLTLEVGKKYAFRLAYLKNNVIIYDSDNCGKATVVGVDLRGPLVHGDNIIELLVCVSENHPSDSN